MLKNVSKEGVQMDEEGCLGGCLLPILVVMIIIWFGRYMLHWW